MNRGHAVILLIIAIVVPSAMAARSFAAIRAAGEDVTGTWNLTVETPGGTANPSVVLKQEGQKLSGTYKGRMGETNLAGTIEDKQIRFSVTLKFEDQSFVVTYTGTVDNDTMKGTVQFGDQGSGNWSARRSGS
jgi:hypothetical protein